MATRVITLSCFGIEVTIETDETNTPVSGVITSELHEGFDEDEEVIPDAQYLADMNNAAIDGIESMILPHAMAEVDITTPAYIQGIETVVEAVANNL